MFEGSCVALVTPMLATGEIDEKALENLVEWHISEGTAALVVAGTTGESGALSHNELINLIKKVTQQVGRRIPVLAGTGTQATSSTIALTQAAQEIGVDACLIVTPFYVRPTQAGLMAHYRTVAASVSVPIVLYNNPGRAACDLSAQTVATLSYVPGIIGIKEACAHNVQRLKLLQQQCHPRFKFYSGEDATALAFIRQGGHGVISVTANVAASLMQQMCRYALSQQYDKAHAIDERLAALHFALMLEANPIAVKWALYYLGKIQAGLRLPLTTLSCEHQATLQEALKGI